MKAAPVLACTRISFLWTGLVVVAMGVVAIGAVLLMLPGPNHSHLPTMVAVTPPQHSGHPIYVQTHEVTIAQWNACYDAGACNLRLRPPTYAIGAGDYPATGLSWVDASEYLHWIKQTTGHPFRLPTAPEWFAIAASVLPDTPDPIFTDPDLSWASSYLMEAGKSRRLQPSGSFAITAEGIADLDGNVWEWTQDCYAGSGSDFGSSDCPAFVVAGEHAAVMSFLVRDPARGGCAVGAPPAHLGLRLVTDTPPPPVSG